MRNNDDKPPAPFHIKFSTTAMQQAHALTPASRQRLTERLLQLADLAAFAIGYSITVAHIEKLVADVQGISIRYEVDDHARTLTVLELSDTGSRSSGEHTVHRIK